jgi:hypothetical protein
MNSVVIFAFACLVLCLISCRILKKDEAQIEKIESDLIDEGAKEEENGQRN